MTWLCQNILEDVYRKAEHAHNNCNNISSWFTGIMFDLTLHRKVWCSNKCSVYYAITVQLLVFSSYENVHKDLLLMCKHDLLRCCTFSLSLLLSHCCVCRNDNYGYIHRWFHHVTNRKISISYRHFRFSCRSFLIQQLFSSLLTMMTLLQFQHERDWFPPVLR